MALKGICVSSLSRSFWHPIKHNAGLLNSVPSCHCSRNIHIVTAFVRSYYLHELQRTGEACPGLFAYTVVLTAAPVTSFPLSLPLIFIIATLSQSQRYQYFPSGYSSKKVRACVHVFCVTQKLYCVFSLTGSGVAAERKVMIQQENTSVQMCVRSNHFSAPFNIWLIHLTCKCDVRTHAYSRQKAEKDSQTVWRKKQL